MAAAARARGLWGLVTADKTPTDKQISDAAADAPGLVREILNEVKANGVGDNKNVLVELNIEQTRHNEIQLLGNGQWCIALGGRDCSLQMHEQKLLEISVTQEALNLEAEKAEKKGLTKQAQALKEDLVVLKRMEEESERFGVAVGLDSASTFECIVDGTRHYFMEVNTRIQVEHRVTELVYSLKFTNPDDKNDFFVVESLVEAMALMAVHKERLPRPERIARFGAAAEARLNATDASLSPSAGGVIRYWSKPIEGEIRDDQGSQSPIRIPACSCATIWQALTIPILPCCSPRERIAWPATRIWLRSCGVWFYAVPTWQQTWNFITVWLTGSSATTLWPSRQPALLFPT